MKNSDNYKKCSDYDNINLLKTLNLTELNNLKILNIMIEHDKVFNDEEEIYIKDIFPNLIKLKIKVRALVKYYNKEPIFNISYHLLKQIEDLTLASATINIEHLNNNNIEFPSLKYLKIKNVIFITTLNERIFFPNIQYFLIEYYINLTNPDCHENSMRYFGFYDGHNDLNNYLNNIHLIFPYLSFFKYLKIENFRFIGDMHRYEITMRKFENNLIKYEKRYADSKIYDGKHDPYEIYYNTCSYFNNKKNIGNSDNYVEIYYKYANIYDNDIYKILLEKSDFNNYSIQYLDIIISKEINMLDFIDNIKNFKFLKSFCLIVEVESLFQSKDLLNLVSNLSSLQLLENIGILIFGNINMTKEDEIIILNKFKNIKI